jgi:hypothetical protein
MLGVHISMSFNLGVNAVTAMLYQMLMKQGMETSTALTNRVYIFIFLFALISLAKHSSGPDTVECLEKLEGICPKRIRAALCPRTNCLSHE